MALTDNQRVILTYAREHNNTITKKEACQLIKYYHNTEKHVGDVLSRMVKSNLLRRIKNGVFEVASGEKNTYTENDPNQLEIF